MRRSTMAAMLCCAALAAGPLTGQQAPEKPPQFFFEKGKEPAAPANPAVPETKPPEGEQTAKAAAATAFPVFDFEAGTQVGYWKALDPDAGIAVATGPGLAHRGDGCLRTDYGAREGVFEQFEARPLQGTAGKTLAFWVKTSERTQLSLGVVEQGGAFYQQFCVTPADTWVPVSLPLASLILSPDTQDADGRLRPEDIVAIRVADLANLPGLADALGTKQGNQELWLDDVAVTTDEAPAVGEAPNQGLLAEGFEREAVHALAVGGAELTRGEGARGAGLKIVCQEPGPRWRGLVMGIGHLPLADKQAVSCQVRASAPVAMSVVLEERDGSKYSRRFRIDPQAGWSEQAFPLEQLLLETDSQDENGVLDRDQIRVLVLVADTAGILNNAPLTIGLDDVIFR